MGTVTDVWPDGEGQGRLLQTHGPQARKRKVTPGNSRARSSKDRHVQWTCRCREASAGEGGELSAAGPVTGKRAPRERRQSSCRCPHGHLPPPTPPLSHHHDCHTNGAEW